MTTLGTLGDELTRFGDLRGLEGGAGASGSSGTSKKRKRFKGKKSKYLLSLTPQHGVWHITLCDWCEIDYC